MKLYNNYKKQFFQDIGSALKQLRTERELELSEMKEITGYSAKKISDIEAGDDSRLLMIPMVNLMRLFEYFDKKFRFVVEDLTVEDRVGSFLNDISSEDLIKLVAARSEKQQEEEKSCPTS